MDERTKRKAEDELTEIVNEYKRGKLSIDTENGRRIEEKSPGKPSPLELPGVRNSSGYTSENGPPRSSRQVSCEVRVDVVDKNTLIWLESKQNALLFSEEYGVEIVRLETPLSDNTEAKAETQLDDMSRQAPPLSDIERKAESQSDSLCFRISMETTGTCDYEDAQWFVKQASNFLSLIASQGVYAKCFWYEGPIPRGSDGSPAVSAVVKKIKGHDGKNLERIQERTGVIIGVVLNNKAISVAQSGITDLPHRVIGVRLRCVRMRGVRDASKKIQQLLGLAGNYFLKETSLDARERETADSDSTHGGSPPLPPSAFGVKRNLVPRTGGQCSTTVSLPLYTPFEKQEGKSREGYLYREVPPDPYPPRGVLCREPPHTEAIHEEPEDISQFEARNTSNLLYIYNLPGHIPVRILKSIFQKVLSEKLELPYTREVVIHAIVASDESYAIVQLASEGFVSAALQLYSEDKTVFDGLKVGLPRVMISKATTARPSYYSGGVGVKSLEPISYSCDERYIQKDSFPYGSRRNPESRFNEHDYRHNRKSIPWWDQVTDDEPNTLFLTELTIHASAQSIRNLFEDILTHYIGPPLVSSSGRKLVLDVRYVHSKQCAFVDMATPELVDFMLDLHSQRPELFDFMKMEIGNKYINENKEEQLVRPDWVQHDIRPGGYPPIKPRGIPHVEPLGGHGFIGRNARGMRSFDFTQESTDNYYSTFDFRKRPKSDMAFPRLERFLQRLARHPTLSRSRLLRCFIESNQWNVDMHTHLAHPPVSEPTTSILEMASDTLLNAFSKVRKPDERFVEIREGLDRLEERLGAIERIEGRSRNRISDLASDYEELAASVQGLGFLESGITEPLSRFETALLDYSIGLRDLNSGTTTPLLHKLVSLIHYSDSFRNVLKLRDQKQLDFEDLSAYLSNITTERDRTAAGYGGLGLSSYLKEKMELFRGAEADTSREAKIHRLDTKIKDLQDAVTSAHETSDAFNEQVLKEHSIFQSGKRLELKELLSDLADGNIAMYKKSIQDWENMIPFFERIRVDT